MKRKHPHFLRYFLQGLLALLPLIVSWFVINFLFNWARAALETILVFIPYHYREIPFWAVVIEILTALFLVVLIAGFGFMVKTIIGKTIIAKVDVFFSSIPLLKSIYKATRQIVDMVGGPEGSESFFTRPVLVEYPSADIWVIAFNTGAVRDPSGAKRECHTLFVPTSPNPTSGFMIIMPDYKIRPLDIPVEDAVKMVLTGGMVKVESLKG